MCLYEIIWEKFNIVANFKKSIEKHPDLCNNVEEIHSCIKNNI